MKVCGFTAAFRCSSAGVTRATTMPQSPATCREKIKSVTIELAIMGGTAAVSRHRIVVVRCTCSNCSRCCSRVRLGGLLPDGIARSYRNHLTKAFTFGKAAFKLFPSKIYILNDHE